MHTWLHIGFMYGCCRTGFQTGNGVVEYCSGVISIILVIILFDYFSLLIIISSLGDASSDSTEIIIFSSSEI
jgi:hypothetical protein